MPDDSTARQITTLWNAIKATLVLSMLLTGAVSATTANDGEAMVAAAQKGDIAEVKRLLDAGADVNAKSSYGANALTFAAFRGNEELALLLLDRGIDVNVKDRFYGFAPLALAVNNKSDLATRKRLAMAILEQQPEDPEPALLFGVQQADLAMIRAAAAQSSPKSLQTALAQAESRGISRVIDLLRELTPEVATEDVIELSPDQLTRFEGDYRNEELGMQIKIFRDASVLKLQVAGQQAFNLAARSEMEFYTTELADVELRFAGRAGTIERFELTQGGQTMPFVRTDASPQTLAADADTSSAPTTPVDLPAALRSDPKPWPSFRGHNGAGIADGQGAPLTWNVEDDTNVLWKSPVPGVALASPVIWGEKVFIASAASSEADSTFRTGLYGDVDSIEDDSVHRWIVRALDLHTGELLWQRTASQGRPKVKRHLKSSHANPTPVTDGEHLVVSFGSEGLFCYDLDGQLLWKRDLGVLNSGWFYDPTFEWGFSSSPILYKGRVIVQVDIQQDSFIAAYDVAEGTELWRTSREEIPTWGTPSVLEGPDGAELITNGTTIRGYDAESGDELWTLGPNSEVTVATPVIAEGRAYVTANYPPVRPIYVIEPGGRGDISLEEGETSNDHIVWSAKRGGVYIPSPIVYQGIYYAMQMNGRLTAYDAATGETIYRQRVGSADSFSSSSVAADGKLYFTTEEGTTYVVRAGREYELLATNDVGEVVMSTPAISDGVMVIRGLDHVFGLAESRETTSD